MQPEPARREEAQLAEEEERRKIEEDNRRREEHERKIEAQKREADRQRAEWERRQEEEKIEAANPINELKDLYANYKYLKVCYAVLPGYLLVYQVNDIEMDRTKSAVSAIERQLLSETPQF